VLGSLYLWVFGGAFGWRRLAGFLWARLEPVMISDFVSGELCIVRVKFSIMVQS